MITKQEGDYKTAGWLQNKQWRRLYDYTKKCDYVNVPGSALRLATNPVSVDTPSSTFCFSFSSKNDDLYKTVISTFYQQCKFNLVLLKKNRKGTLKPLSKIIQV